MDAMFYLEDVKDIIKSLQEFGNFDEFNDHREDDGINESATLIIAEKIAKIVEREIGL